MRAAAEGAHGAGAGGTPARRPTRRRRRRRAQAFAAALRVPVETVRAGRSASRRSGCDSLRIVEITVALSEQFPWLPGTLLFEHRAVSQIVTEIVRLSRPQARSRAGRRVRAAREPASRVGRRRHRRRRHGRPVRRRQLARRTVGPAERGPQRRRRRCPPTGRTSCGRSSTRVRTGPGCSTASAASTPSSSASRRAKPRSWTRSCGSSSRWRGRRSRTPAASGAGHDPSTGVFAGVMYGDYGYRANAGVAAAASPYRCWEGFSLANRLSQLLGLPRPEPGGRHGLLVVGHRAPPGVPRAQGGRVPGGDRRRRQPDPRSRSVRVARPARHPVGPRRVRAVRRRRRRHRARRGRRRRGAAAAGRRAAPRRSHLRRHQGHRSQHRQRHRRLHGAEPAGAVRGDSPQPARRAASIRARSRTSRRTARARCSAIRSKCAA